MTFRDRLPRDFSSSLARNQEQHHRHAVIFNSSRTSAEPAGKATTTQAAGLYLVVPFTHPASPLQSPPANPASEPQRLSKR